MMRSLEVDQGHVEMLLDADEEIKQARRNAMETIASVRQVGILHLLLSGQAQEPIDVNRNSERSSTAAPARQSSDLRRGRRRS